MEMLQSTSKRVGYIMEDFRRYSREEYREIDGYIAAEGEGRGEAEIKKISGYCSIFHMKKGK